MNQAEIIRELAVEMLTHNKSLQEDIEFNSQKTKGIRYSVLKKELLNCTQYKFTDGGVTGALYTLPDRVDGVFKVKTKKGVFFYYSSKDYQVNFISKVIITESKEYKELSSQVEDVSNSVRDILLNASNQIYKKTNAKDLDYLRKLLHSTSQLKSILKEYEIEKSFEKIEDNNGSELPF